MSPARSASKTRPPKARPARGTAARPPSAPQPQDPPLATPHRVRTACLLGLVCFVVYASNLRTMAARDSIPARLLPFSILREGNLDFNEFHWLFHPKPYFLYQTPRGHWLSRYSIAVPALLAPLSVPAVLWLHRNQINDDDVRFRLATAVMERIDAALVAAASVSVTFLCLCRMTSLPMAAAMALAYGLGTSIWSVGSQSMLQHGPAALTLAGMSLFLMAPDTRRNAVAAGGCAGLAVLARPTMLLFVLLALLFVWRERRRNLLAFLAPPLTGMALLLAYLSQFAHPLRGGYSHLLFGKPHLSILAGLLVSPNRGLFIYTPATLLALPLLVRRDADLPRWVAYLPLGLAAYLGMYTFWHGWWGGNTYGPRFFTDAVPALVLLAAPTVQRLWRTRAGQLLVLALVAWGVAVQAVGVYWDDNTWNRGKPGHRLWEWSDTQIRRAAGSDWHGTELAPLLWQVFSDPRPVPVVALKADDLAGDITIAAAQPLHSRRSEKAMVPTWITNRSDAPWPGFSDFGYLQCMLGYRWWFGNAMLGVAGAVSLPRNVGPGESSLIEARIDTPTDPGLYDLELMLVQLTGANKALLGSAVVRVPVQID